VPGSKQTATFGSPTVAKPRVKEVRKPDPLADKQDERAAPTFKDLADHYVEKHLPKKRASSAKTDRQTIDNVLLPKLGMRKVTEITFTDIDNIHHKITERGTPYRANRVVALLSKMFALAIRKKWRADNPAKGIDRNREHKRARYLSNDELTRLKEFLFESAFVPSYGFVGFAGV
jgi:site-specific recombinase XerD